MENRKTCRNAQCFCDGSCQDLIKSDINYTSVIPMENKTAEEILKEFENFCGNLAVSGDSPSSDTIKQYFDEYASQKLAEKDKEIDIFAIGFAKWIRENGYGYSKKFNLYQKSLINETIFFYEKELIELYKQSLNK